MTSRADNRIRRIGLIAVLAFVLGQSALIGHTVSADHGLGEPCQTCVLGERLDDSHDSQGAPAVCAQCPSYVTSSAPSRPGATPRGLFQPRAPPIH